MLFLNPARVTLLGRALEHVGAVSVDRSAAKFVAEWGDSGPHVVFADAPEQRVTVTISRRVAGDEATPARPGDQGLLTFTAGAGSDDLGNRAYSATVVVESVEHGWDAKRGGTQRIRAVAVSADGVADPVAEATQ